MPYAFNNVFYHSLACYGLSKQDSINTQTGPKAVQSRYARDRTIGTGGSCGIK